MRGFETRENRGTVLLFLSPCFRIEEVNVSPLTFAGTGKTETAAKTTGKTGTAKTGTAAKKTTTAKKTSAARAVVDALKLTATEKKLVELYRKADTKTKKAAINLLEGDSNAIELIGALMSSKGSGSTSGTGSSSGTSDILNALLSGHCDLTPLRMCLRHLGKRSAITTAEIFRGEELVFMATENLFRIPRGKAAPDSMIFHAVQKN